MRPAGPGQSWWPGSSPKWLEPGTPTGSPRLSGTHLDRGSPIPHRHHETNGPQGHERGTHPGRSAPLASAQRHPHRLDARRSRYRVAGQRAAVHGGGEGPRGEAARGRAVPWTGRFCCSVCCRTMRGGARRPARPGTSRITAAGRAGSAGPGRGTLPQAGGGHALEAVHQLRRRRCRSAGAMVVLVGPGPYGARCAAPVRLSPGPDPGSVSGVGAGVRVCAGGVQRRRGCPSGRARCRRLVSD